MSELTGRAQPVARQRSGLRRSGLAWTFGMYLALIGFALIFVLPVLWMLSTSLKNTEQTYTVPPIWIPYPLRLENYPEAMAAQPFAKFFENTIQFAVLSSIGAVISCSLVAYGFARIRWYGRGFL